MESSSSKSHPKSKTRNSITNDTEHDKAAENDQSWRYLPLRTAALKGDWESARRFFDQDENAITARITARLQTTLHVAVGTGKAVHFVEKLVELMPAEALAMQDIYHETALHFAATVGNTSAADILVKKNPALLYIMDLYGALPVHKAAINGHKDTLLYLITVTKDDGGPNPFADKSGALLLIHVIVSGFYDVALDLVQRYPQMSPLILGNGDSPLNAIARKPSAFPSGSRLNFWEHFIYHRVPVKLEESYTNNFKGGDVENPTSSSQVLVQICSWSWVRQIKVLCQRLHLLLWEVIQYAVPHAKQIKDKKLMHNQALQLVRLLCKQVRSLNDSNAYRMHNANAVFVAARLNIREVVEQIVEIYPSAAWFVDIENHYIFEVAVLHRCENVFNLIYQMSEHKHYITSHVDTSCNNILHLAGRLAPPHKLNCVSGAALQMQRELQWFKEVEKFVNPDFKENENSDGKTPEMVFTEAHKDLVIQGEKWMKDTANSCTIAAALIATVVFAAAITVPGGNSSDNGRPILYKENAFIIFAISDAISLFTSTTSLLMFLSILTSRYAESDFLLLLPKRLIIGLVSLFLSITTMMIAFSATLYLVFGHGKAWILIPLAALACLPVTSFVSLQFPLLVDVISSTYGPGIFGKKSDRPFY